MIKLLLISFPFSQSATFSNTFEHWFAND